MNRSLLRNPIPRRTAPPLPHQRPVYPRLGGCQAREAASWLLQLTYKGRRNLRSVDEQRHGPSILVEDNRGIDDPAVVHCGAKVSLQLNKIGVIPKLPLLGSVDHKVLAHSLLSLHVESERG